MRADRAPASEPGSSARDVGQRVQQIITALLAGRSGGARIGRVAEKMATSVRTLQRRLRRAGLTYSNIVQRARCAAAERMLKDGEVGIGDVARALGYSDPAHFTRAFQRWTGSTPRNFRSRAASSGKALSTPHSVSRAHPRVPGGASSGRRWSARPHRSR